MFFCFFDVMKKQMRDIKENTKSNRCEFQDEYQIQNQSRKNQVAYIVSQGFADKFDRQGKVKGDRTEGHCKLHVQRNEDE